MGPIVHWPFNGAPMGPNGAPMGEMGENNLGDVLGFSFLFVAFVVFFLGFSIIPKRLIKGPGHVPILFR